MGRTRNKVFDSLGEQAIGRLATVKNTDGVSTMIPRKRTHDDKNEREGVRTYANHSPNSVREALFRFGWIEPEPVPLKVQDTVCVPEPSRSSSKEGLVMTWVGKGVQTEDVEVEDVDVSEVALEMLVKLNVEEASEAAEATGSELLVEISLLVILTSVLVAGVEVLVSVLLVAVMEAAVGDEHDRVLLMKTSPRGNCMSCWQLLACLHNGKN